MGPTSRLLSRQTTNLLSSRQFPLSKPKHHLLLLLLLPPTMYSTTPTTGEGDPGLMTIVKDFFDDVGEKIDDAVPFGKPTAEVSSVGLASMDFTHADIVVDIQMHNPNLVPIPLVDIHYLIESEGRTLISGVVPDASTLAARSSETLQVPLSLIYSEINSTYNEIGPGSLVSLRAYVELIMDIPVVGRVTVPVERTGEIRLPYKPQVDLIKIKLDKFSFEETTATLHLKIENENDFEMKLNSMDCDVWLGDMNIGGARLAQSATIERKTGGSVEIPISFRPKDFGSALWDIVKGNGVGYTMKGCINVESPFGPSTLPFHREGGNAQISQRDDNNDDDDGSL